MPTGTSAKADLSARIAEAYRWQRRLGLRVIEAPHCAIVADPAKPDLWDANHADDVTAATDDKIDAVLAAMDQHLAHSDWRVVHTDAFTPDCFLARLAYLGFEERPVVVQMTCERLKPMARAPVELVEIADDDGWAALTALVRADVAEGKRTGGLDLDDAVVDDMVANYRAKAPAYRFHLAVLAGAPVAYGAMIAAPNGMGMIEDLFTLPSARRRGIASTMIAHFDAALRAEGCTGIFLGAVAAEEAKSLYYNLGFRPAMLSRCWVKQVRQDD
jgi:GNAT superfamily N-acetyltransferase